MRVLLFIVAVWYAVTKLPTGTGVFSVTGIPFDALATAIQIHEGYAPGTRSYRNNNPGNLRYAGQYEATGSDSAGFAVFPTYDAGRRALIAQLRLDAQRNPQWTLYDFIMHYAPPSDGNNVGAYVDALISSLNSQGYRASDNTTLGEFA